MVTEKSPSRYSETYEDLRPLIELCKAGRLFDVQKWIDDGGPLELPLVKKKGTRRRSPLEYAIHQGFHSLVEVLLKGGASPAGDDTYSPMEHALLIRRIDFVELLVEHGFDPKSVNMECVFNTWEPRLMEYFIERGADVETDMPLAIALCSRIRTALKIFKQYRERFPSFQEQANIALRHHCREGNLKWVSLMIWAGADPMVPGDDDPNQDRDPEYPGLTALGLAALYGRFEVFDLKKIKLPIDHPATHEVLRFACKGKGLPIVEQLLQKGLSPNDQANGGSSMIQSCIEHLEWYRGWSYFFDRRNERLGDSEEAKDILKAIHLLAKRGGRWKPKDRGQINAARRSLLRMKPEYTAEFVWIMARHTSCEKEDVEQLVKSPKMMQHLSPYMSQIRNLLVSWKETAPTQRGKQPDEAHAAASPTSEEASEHLT